MARNPRTTIAFLYHSYLSPTHIPQSMTGCNKPAKASLGITKVNKTILAIFSLLFHINGQNKHWFLCFSGFWIWLWCFQNSPYIISGTKRIFLTSVVGSLTLTHPGWWKVSFRWDWKNEVPCTWALTSQIYNGFLHRYIWVWKYFEMMKTSDGPLDITFLLPSCPCSNNNNTCYL